ncbi:MAG: hypothetical protein KDD06_23055, partial [Phaeodactylibacter sp.]|nr:hypothetical protein [Phaeodactylibacter sp.]
IKTEEAAEESELLRVLRAVYQHYFKPIYLIFDQFEELFILGSRPEQEAFYRSIAEILETEAYCHIIFIMREESIAQLYDFEREVPTLFDKRMRIEPLERKRTSEVISKTTAKFGITLLNDTIPGQIIELLSEGKGRVELTYLQVFLDQLYQEAAARSSNGVVFTENLIREFGNIENVLGDFLNKQTAIIQSELEKEFPEALSSAAAKVLNTFVTLEGTKRPLERQQVNVGGLSDAQISLVIGMLEKSRILRLEGNRYELAHDALAHQIARQRSAEEVSLLQIARIVRDRYRVYETTRTPLNSNELQLINTYRQQLEEEQLLSPEEWEFVRRSKRANRRRLILLVATVLLIIVSLAALALYSNYQRQEAQRQKQEAQRQEQEASRLLEEVQQAQEQQKAANYEKFFNEGKAAMAVADYSGAMQAFQTALVFDSLRQEARDSLLAAENKLGAGARFGQLIREGDALYNREDNSLYIDALRKYQEALRLNFNNSLAQSKIEATTVKLNAAFDALRDAGDTFFRTGSTFGYQQAL